MEHPSFVCYIRLDARKRQRRGNTASKSESEGSAAARSNEIKDSDGSTNATDSAVAINQRKLGETLSRTTVCNKMQGRAARWEKQVFRLLVHSCGTHT